MLTSLVWLFSNLQAAVSVRAPGTPHDMRELFGELQRAENEPKRCQILQKAQATLGDAFSFAVVYDVAYYVLGYDAEGRLNGTAFLRCVEDMGIPVNQITSKREETLLFPAVGKNRNGSGVPQAVSYLLSKHVPTTQRDRAGYSAAEVAIEHGCWQCLQLLLNAEVDPSGKHPARCTKYQTFGQTCHGNWTLAHFAALHGETKSLETLKEKGAVLNATDVYGLVPVQIAAIHGRSEILSMLGERNAGFDAVDAENRTLAHLACHYGRVGEKTKRLVQCLEIIARLGGRMNATDNFGNTPAHICASDGDDGSKSHPQALEILYEVAPDSFEKRNMAGLRPEDIADDQKNMAQVFFAERKAKDSAEEADKSAKEARAAQKHAQELLEKEKNMRETEENISVTCKAMAREVDELFDCEQRNITVPAGVMVVLSHESCDGHMCAMKCPNAMACPKERKYKEQQCAEGYANRFNGCARCVEGYGRHRRDPFQCRKCATHQWTQWLSYAIKPLAIYGVSLWTARKVEKDRMASVLKIWLSFSTLVASLSPSIQSSKQFQAVHCRLTSSAQAGQGFGSLMSHLTGPSYDCLLQSPAASTRDWLFLTLSDMLVLWCLSIIGVLGQWMRTHPRQNLAEMLRHLLKVNIIITNCFLADVVAAFVRYYPCFHFQERKESPKYLQVNPLTPCDSVFWMRIGALTAALCLITLGPAYWVAVIRWSKAWAEDDRKICLGFLISGYREGDWPQEATSEDVHKDKPTLLADVSWWEATVLFRKCALAVAASTFSVSYSPELFLSSMLLIVGLTLAFHAYVQPYKDLFLNRLEFLTLIASFVAVFSTFILHLESVAWATDDTVTIPAFISLIGTVLIPFGSLMVLYTRELMRQYPGKIQHLRLRFLSATTGT
mmetsp:Transcript_59338/g.138963  ORF Transcript_59338/g.138963 Transcript_59338/m.138963 type:complete len:895 (-) Transcript_59338:113-2797(-)